MIFRISQKKLTNLESVKFLYFGRLTEEKGAKTAIEALGFLKRKGLLDQARTNNCWKRPS
jgi:glycosyltransferase involved in cell wall biosynthesis